MSNVCFSEPNNWGWDKFEGGTSLCPTLVLILGVVDSVGLDAVVDTDDDAACGSLMMSRELL